ncbi:hypothetical protein [Rhodanobacter sp. FW106-PBR-LB-2-11]|uniref:hypothetical protein n=1 Tax=Rhodanobacter sp. FW106-PBR-LB-2-11 TaxID=1524463 RepID=UPI003F745E7C
MAGDALLRTSVDGVFAAGGRSASAAATARGSRRDGRPRGSVAPSPRQALSAPARARLRGLLRKAFAGPAYPRAGRPGALVCRCEDVPLGALADLPDARDAKLASRCGMGACQGRICGTALAELGVCRPEASSDGGRRPPLFPVRLAALAESFTHDPQEKRP